MEIDILNYIQTLHTSVGDLFMPFISKLGNGGFIWIVLDMMLIIIPKTRKTGIVVAFAIVLDVLLCNGLIKPLIARIRPCNIVKNVNMLIPTPTDFSFPSGHTAISFAVTSALYFCRNKICIPSLILGSLIAFSRMYLYVHYPSDILGGIILGVLVGKLAYNFVNYRFKLRDKKKGSVAV